MASEIWACLRERRQLPAPEYTSGILPRGRAALQAFQNMAAVIVLPMRAHGSAQTTYKYTQPRMPNSNGALVQSIEPVLHSHVRADT